MEAQRAGGVGVVYGGRGSKLRNSEEVLANAPS